MADYDLAHGEHVVMTQENVWNGSSPSSRSELVLTNKNVIWVDKTLLGKTKDLQKYPLAGMQPAELKGGASPSLVVRYSNHKVCFNFMGEKKKKVQKWVNQINALLADQSHMQSNQPVSSQQDFAVQAAATATHARQSLGHSATTVKCAFCGAPLHGHVGKTGRCSYCDSEQVLSA